MYLLPFRIYEQLRACPEKQSLPWKFSLYWIFFLPFRIVERLCACPEVAVLNTLFTFRIVEQRLPWKTEHSLKFFTVLESFSHSGFLSNLRLPWKLSLSWNFSSRGGAAASPSHTPMLKTEFFSKTWCQQLNSDSLIYFLPWQFISRYDTHTAQNPGSLFWWHAVVSLQFTNVCSFSCMGRLPNLRADCFIVGLYCVTNNNMATNLIFT